MVGIGGIGKPVDLGCPPQRRKGEHTMVQHSTTTQQQIPRIRVCTRQLSVTVGEKMQAVLAHHPTPRLRVVHRRRSDRQQQG